MKKLITTSLLALFLTISFTSISHAQDNDKKLGIGIRVGEPTGLTLKSWTSSTTAFDVGLAWSLGQYNDALSINADYLWHNFQPFNDVENGALAFYYGIGGRVVFIDDNPNDDNAVIGARVPLGLNYLFDDAPVGVFIQIAPTLNLTPSTDFDVDGAVGVRFYLK